MAITAICLDTETTGVNPECDEILELSIVDQDGTPLFHGYFKPENHTEWPNAEAVNGISPVSVSVSPTFSDCRDQIQQIIDTPSLTAVIGYNTQFDLRMLESAGIRIPHRIEVIDVMREFAPIYGQPDEIHGDFKWQKLVTCADYYHYDWTDHAHDSMADTLATLFCYKKIRGDQ